MFVKYVIDKTQVDNQTNHDAVTADIAGILNGTITSISQCTSNLCNKPVSTFSGAINTALYKNVTVTNSDQIDFAKHHYNNSGAYTPKTNVTLLWTYGAYPKVRTHAGNETPTGPTDSIYWPVSLSSNAFAESSNYNNATKYINIDNILMYVSDYWFVIQFNVGDKSSTAIVMDYEDTVADQYSFDTNSNCSPQYCWFTDVSDTDPFINASVDFVLGRHHYLDRANTLQTRSLLNDGYTFGYWANNDSNAFPTITSVSVFPTPRVPQAAVQMTTGEAHMLTPVFAIPSVGGDTQGTTTFGKVPNFYRTTDNLTSSGDTVTYNTTEYVILVLHKTGGYHITASPNNACYALPKLIGGV